MAEVRKLIHLCPGCDSLYDPKGVRHVGGSICNDIQQMREYHEKISKKRNPTYELEQWQICPQCGTRLRERTNLDQHLRSGSCIATGKRNALRRRDFERYEGQICVVVDLRGLPKHLTAVDDTGFKMAHWGRGGGPVRQAWIAGWVKRSLLWCLKKRTHAPETVDRATIEKLIEADKRGPEARRAIELAAQFGGETGVRELVLP